MVYCDFSNSLYKYFPPELVENELCEYCGINLVKHRKSKSNMNFSNENKNEYYSDIIINLLKILLISVVLPTPLVPRTQSLSLLFKWNEIGGISVLS